MDFRSSLKKKKRKKGKKPAVSSSLPPIEFRSLEAVSETAALLLLLLLLMQRCRLAERREASMTLRERD